MLQLLLLLLLSDVGSDEFPHLPFPSSIAQFFHMHSYESREKVWKQNETARGKQNSGPLLTEKRQIYGCQHLRVGNFFAYPRPQWET